MSGTHAPAVRSAALTLRLPRARGLDQGSQAINAAFDLIERADANNVKTGQQSTFPGIVLLSPSQIGFLLTVTDAGALVVTQLPPTRPF
jgi:hypothetical protein